MNDTNLEFEKFASQRNNFYRNQFRRLTRVLIALLFISVGLLFGIFSTNWVMRKPHYYASTTTGSIVPLNPLSKPVVTTSFILQWAQVVCRSAYNLNFSDYQGTLKKISKYFTSGGWQSYMSALKRSGVISDMVQNKLQINSVISGVPVVINRYVLSGRYTWEVQMPLLIVYNSSSSKVKKKVTIRLTIQQVPSLVAARGVAVKTFQVSS